MANKRQNRTRWFCTACGKECPQTDGGRPQWGRHVYGTFSEARCGQDCAWKPVVDTEAQRTLERMGDIVVRWRLEHEGLDRMIQVR